MARMFLYSDCLITAAVTKMFSPLKRNSFYTSHFVLDLRSIEAKFFVSKTLLNSGFVSTELA